MNCSIIFTELPLLERPKAARDAGFDAIELWWPFAEALPSEQEVKRFIETVSDADVDLVYMNLYGGDSSSGDRGILSHPGRQSEFLDNLAVATQIGRSLSIRGFNVLYGNRLDGMAPQDQDELAQQNLALAAKQLGETSGMCLMLEALSGVPRYPLLLARDAVEVMEACEFAAASAKVGLLADFYHYAVNGDDVPRVISEFAAKICHVQIADAPGRREPGTGTLDLSGWLAQLDQAHYSGYVSLEYMPSTTSEESLAFLPISERSARRHLLERGS